MKLSSAQENPGLSAIATSAINLLPSIQMMRLDFAAPDGYISLNPSIISTSNGLCAIVRTVRYSPQPVTTRNFWVTLDDELAITSSKEIVASSTYPDRVRFDCIGLEDMRPFMWNDQVWVVASSRELNPKGWWSESGIARLDFSNDSRVEFTDFSIIAMDGNPGLHEKNWMPHIENNQLRFVYSGSPFVVVDDRGSVLLQRHLDLRPNVIRGGTQFLPFDDGWICVTHEVFYVHEKRYYAHRLIYCSHDYSNFKFSRRFFFCRSGVEFAAGIARAANGKDILVSFGVEDRECWIARIKADDITASLLVLDDAFGASDARVLSPALGGTFWKADPLAREFFNKNICGALKSEAQFARAAKFIGFEGLKNHKDKRMAWNEFLALYYVTSKRDKNATILESFIRSVRELGYKSVTGLDKELSRDENHRGVEWIHKLPDGLSQNKKFDFIYYGKCIHEINESKRILQIISTILNPGAAAFFSFIFWEVAQSDVKSPSLGGILCKSDILLFVGCAATFGMYPAKEIDFSCENPTMGDDNREKTLLNIIFIKKAF
jgi:hypothetical protein